METTEKEVVRRYYEMVNAGSPERFDEICSPDLKGHAGAGADLAELKNSVASFLAPFPDLTAELRHLVQEGDLISRWACGESLLSVLPWGAAVGERRIPGAGR